MSDSSQVTLLRFEQRRGWQAGQPVPVEIYLEREPALRDNPDGILDLIYNEIVLREEAGDAPCLEEYIRRFPQFDDQLRAQFEVHRAILANPLTPDPGALTPSWSTPPRLVLPVPAPRSLPRIPGYEISREVGRGGMGVVYQARHLALKRMVALKMIVEGVHAGPAEIARFHTEAEAVARLTHPNIVEIYEVGEHEGVPYLALEFVSGESLEARAGGEPLLPGDAARLLETLAGAIDYAHERGIVHRDLKPANILLRDESPGTATTPKITDFGLAKLLDADRAMTPTAAFIGTPNYMAPEQACGNARAVGPAADIYSLGAILYELLTGRPPFKGTTILETLEQVRSTPPVSPRSMQPRLPRDLETICLVCLEKEPQHRYPSARALAEDLRRFREHEPIWARPVPAWRRLLKWATRRPAAAACVGLVGVVISALVLSFPWLKSVSGQAAAHAAEQRYRNLIQLQNDALLYGMTSLAPGLLPVVSPDSGARAIESKARTALNAAGVSFQSNEPLRLSPEFPASVQGEVLSRSCALILVLAETVARQSGQSNSPGNGRTREALAILDQAAEPMSSSAIYHERRARLLESLGRKKEGETELRIARELVPGDPLQFFLLGYGQIQEGKWRQAIDAFDRVLNQEPDHFWAKLCKAMCYMHLDRPEWAAAKTALDGCAAQEPGFAWLYVLRGRAQQELAKSNRESTQSRHLLKAADDDFTKALALSPTADVRYSLLVLRATDFFHENDFARATSALREAIGLRSDDSLAHLTLAEVLLAQGDLDAGAREAEEAIRLKAPPGALFHVYLLRGETAFRQGRYDDALESCDAALSLYSNSAWPHKIRAGVFLKKEQWSAAVKAYDRYLDRGGEEKKDAYRGRAFAYRQLGNYSKALEDYSRALEIDPNAETYAHRGWAYVLLDSWKLAAADFDKAIHLDPAPADPYVGRGLARVMLRDVRAGTADADEAIRRNVADPAMFHNLACLFAQASARTNMVPGEDSSTRPGDAFRQRAVEMLRKALEQTPISKRRVLWKESIAPELLLTPVRNIPAYKRLESETLGSPGK